MHARSIHPDRALVQQTRLPDIEARVSSMAIGRRARHDSVMSHARTTDDEERPHDAPVARAVFEQLFASRTVMIFGEIDTALAQSVTAQLLALAAISNDPIRVLVHSQGGHVESGDTIFDVVRAIRPEVKMIGTGWVVSAGALIYTAAKHGNRVALPNTRFLLHQPLGGVRGPTPTSDIEIEANQILRVRERLNRRFAEATGQDLQKIARDTDRNLWMSAEEARAYGLVDRIVESLAEA